MFAPPPPKKKIEARETAAYSANHTVVFTSIDVQERGYLTRVPSPPSQGNAPTITT